MGFNFEQAPSPKKSAQELKKITPEEIDAAIENMEPVGEIQQLQPTKEQLYQMTTQDKEESQAAVDDLRARIKGLGTESHVMDVGVAGLHKKYKTGTLLELGPKASAEMIKYARGLERKPLLDAQEAWKKAKTQEEQQSRLAGLGAKLKEITARKKSERSGADRAQL